MNVHINFKALLEGEPLKPDGSNYIDWYERLRISLKRSSAFFMVIEPLGPKPDDDADEYEMIDSVTDGTITSKLKLRSLVP
jgi:hypothetical protein